MQSGIFSGRHTAGIHDNSTDSNRLHPQQLTQLLQHAGNVSHADGAMMSGTGLRPLVHEALGAYREAASGGPSLPSNPEHVDALIQLSTLEKALYELRYELDNRPEWVVVPLRGLLEAGHGSPSRQP